MCSDVRGVGLFCQVDTGPWTLNIPWLVLVLMFFFVVVHILLFYWTRVKYLVADVGSC